MKNWAIYANPSRALTDVTVACLGAGEYRGRHEGFRGRQLRSHAVVVISEGTGWYSSPLTGDIRVEAPALIWLFPGVAHGYGPHRSGWTEHWILFSGAATRALDELGVWRRAVPVVSLDRLPDSLPTTFTGLKDHLSEGCSIGALRASAASYAWLTELAAITMPSSAPDLIDTFTRGATRRMSMQMRARELGVTLAQLRAATVSTTRLTPLQLLIESRLVRAQSLLVETDLEVNDIAQQVGFDDPAYFSRQFSQRLGRSPSIFRREQSRMPALTDAQL